MQIRANVPDLPLGEALRIRPKGIATVGLAVRIAVATTASYFLARQLSGSSFVLFAPVTTLLVVQASPFATLGASLQRVFGTGLGVLLATLYVQLVPVNALTFGIAILAALLVARLLPVSIGAQLQIPVAVVFVLALGTGGLEQDIWRVLDVIIGGLVGIVAVYAWPSKPDFEPAERASRVFLSALTAQLRSIGHELGTLAQPLPDERKHEFTVTSRALRAISTTARDEYAAAVDSVRFHPRARRTGGSLDDMGRQVAWLSGLAIQVRAIGGAVDRLYDRPGLEPALATPVARGLLESCADLIEAVDAANPEARELADGIQNRISLALDEVANGRVPVAEVLQSVSLLGRIDLLTDSTLRGMTDDPDDLDDDHDEAAPAVPDDLPGDGSPAPGAPPVPGRSDR